MDKFREAFEQIPEIAERIKRSKMEYNPEYDFFHAPEWDSQSCSDQDFVNNFRKGWQSRQSEFDAMTEALLKQTQLLAKKRAEINQLQSQINEMAEVGLSQESAIREKDKRIESALSELESLHNKKWAEWKEQADMHSQGEANAYEYAMQILEKVLGGEHEA